MNTPKILTAGILATIALVSGASAQTQVYITGSTAFRTAASNAITAVVGATPVAVDNSATLAAYQGANAQTWSTGSFFVQTSWSGSAAGVQTVSNSVTTVRFLPAAATGNTSPDPRNTANPADLHTPDICFADNKQSSTSFTTNPLNEQQVGVVPFAFVGSNGFPTGLSMTKQALLANFSGEGVVPMSFYTGLASDSGTGGALTRMVYATGRDPDSGTRIVTLAESGYGVGNAVTQWKPVTSGGGVISSMAKYPSSVTINGFTYTSGSGESSGSSLRAFMTYQNPPSQYGETGPSFFVTALGMSDYPRVLAAGAIADTGLTGSDTTGRPATPMNYNGVPFSHAGVKNGSYTFWGYQYCSTRSSGVPGGVTGFHTSLVNNIKATTTANLAGNVALTDMQVDRGTSSADGGPIASKNF